MLVPAEPSEEAIKDCGLYHLSYVPELKAGETRPLVLLMHGRAGTAKVPWVFSKAVQKFKPVTIAPQGFVSDEIGGFSWWPPSEKKLAAGGPGESKPDPEKVFAPVERLRHFISRLSRWYPVDENEMYGIGFSQGAAVLASLSMKEPGLLNGVAMLSGFIPHSVVALLHPPAETVPLKTKYLIVHGTEDEVIPLERAHASAKILGERGAKVETYFDEVPHKVSSSGLRAVEEWFSSRIADT